jgi:hypothetical protein
MKTLTMKVNLTGSLDAAARGNVGVDILALGASDTGEWAGVVDWPAEVPVTECELRYRPCAHDGRTTGYLHAQRMQKTEDNFLDPVGAAMVLPLRQISVAEHAIDKKVVADLFRGEPLTPSPVAESAFRNTSPPLAR